MIFESIRRLFRRTRDLSSYVLQNIADAQRSHVGVQAARELEQKATLCVQVASLIFPEASPNKNEEIASWLMYLLEEALNDFKYGLEAKRIPSRYELYCYGVYYGNSDRTIQHLTPELPIQLNSRYDLLK
jgi:hypothetical protein